jgi:hypothetical protein
MTRQVNSHSLADCFGVDESKNKDDTLSKHVVSDEVLDLIAKIPNRVGVVTFETKFVLKKTVLEAQSA